MLENELKLKDLSITLEDYLHFQWARHGNTRWLYQLLYKYADITPKLYLWEIGQLDYVVSQKYWTLIQGKFLAYDERVQEDLKDFVNRNVPKDFIEENDQTTVVPKSFLGFDFGTLDG